MYIGSAEISAAANLGSNVLGPAGSFPGITNSSLYLPLKTSIVPSRGSSTPTFTRATAAWSFDNEGKLNQNVPSGCARFKGGRLVRNYVATTSATLAVAATNTVTLSRAETVTFSMGAGTGTATFSGTAGATGTLTASPSGRTEVTKTCTSGTFIITASVSTLVDIQVEIVSGQTDQTASEYVSVGALSSPYHGAGTVSGADGCKWFPTNKDGSAIPSSTLDGYFAEPSRINNCLYNRDLRQGSTTTAGVWTSTGIGAELLSNGTFVDGTGWTTGSGWTIGSGVATKTAGVSGSVYTPISLTAGKLYVITFTVVRTAGSFEYSFSGGTSSYGPNRAASGTYSDILLCLPGNTTFRFTGGSTFAGTVDDISIKEAAIQVTTTSGLDNVTNSASRLTAATTDATITQLLTAATGTRTLSAYIKRISGTGTISLTRDGGTGWTDITSSLVTDSWVLVQMTSDVGANPTVGIKMGTSGDVIDVDCVQDEDGAWATSPILTTTAAVTRNGDVLSYASAFDVAQGTALCSLSSVVPITVSGYVALAGDANGRMLRFDTSTARDSGEAWDSTNTATATGLSLLTGIRKRASRWGTDLLMCADGTLGVAAAFDGSMGASTTMYVGCSQTGATQLSGTLRELHIWPTPLTDTQMKQVTS